VDDPSRAAELERLEQQLVGVANAHFHVRSIDAAVQTAIWGRDPTAALNAFVLGVGLGYAHAPVLKWLRMARAEAHAALRDTFRWEQAYDAPRFELTAADQLATSFVALFDEWGQFFTNASFDRTPLGWRATGWYGSVTGGTFEAGIIGADGQRIGLLYVADED